jgi:hypothetical protein
MTNANISLVQGLYAAFGSGDVAGYRSIDR